MTARIASFFTQRDIDEFQVTVYLLRRGEPVEPERFERFVDLEWLAESREGYVVTAQGLARLN